MLLASLCTSSDSKIAKTTIEARLDTPLRKTKHILYYDDNSTCLWSTNLPTTILTKSYKIPQYGNRGIFSETIVP